MNRPLRAIAVLAIVAGLATAGVVAVQQIMRNRIADGDRLAALRALAIVLPTDRYDNDPTSDVVTLSADAWTGSARPVTVRRARKGGQPAALVLDVVAPDGYAGPIRLLVSVDAGGRVLGVRVTAHRETPGLGDPIEAAKSDWITRFTGRFLGNPPAERWRVKRDGGDFDQFASATVTPRAVVAAVERTLQLIDRHGAELYDAPTGTAVVFVDAPEKPAPP
jgi:Na+-translocating ferredoxin:NAD+ oxidoreductase subunit G